MGRRHGHGSARKPERGLDELRPGQPAVRAPEGVEPGRKARDAARADPDGVADELCAEGHFELEERYLAPCSSQPGHRDEAVEVRRPAAIRVEVDRMPAAEKSGHHGLGNARGQAGGDRRVGGAATRFEDLRARVCCGGVPGGDGSHALSVNRVPILG